MLKASVVIRELGAAKWELSVRIEGEGGDEERTFEGESCDAVAEVAATLVSLRVVEWIDSASLVPEPEAPVESTPQPEPRLRREPEPKLAPIEAPSPQTLRRESVPQPAELGGWLSILGGVALGVAPGVGGAVAIEGGLQGQWWRAGFALQTTPRRFRPHPNNSAVRGRFDVLIAEAVGCGVPRAGRVEFPICGRFAAGGMRANGEGEVGRSEPAWGGWWGVGGSAAAVWHVTERWAPVLSVEALAPLREWSYSVGGVPGTLHQTGAVALRAWAGLELHL